MKPKIAVSEIFGPTIQGEGSQIGKPTIFVRTGGCDFTCSFCDSLYAVLPQFEKEWKKMECQEIFDSIESLSNKNPILITLSGGNPAIHDFNELIDIGHSKGYKFTIETQGTYSPDWFNKLDYITLSPKPPSSLMRFENSLFKNCFKVISDHSKITIKIVVSDIRDYQFAKSIFSMYPLCQLYITPCNISPGDPDYEAIYDKMRFISKMILEDGLYNVSITPQLHVLLYGNQRGI